MAFGKKGLFNFWRKNVRKVIFKLFHKKVEVNKKLFLVLARKTNLGSKLSLSRVRIPSKSN